MSQENVEIVRQSFEDANAFWRGELSSEAFAELFDPEIEMKWHDQRMYPDTPQHLRGAAEVVAFSGRYPGEWADLVAEPRELTEGPDGRVVGLARQSSQGRQSGVPVVIHYFAIWQGSS